MKNQTKITPIELADVLTHSIGEYNRAIWKKKVNDYAAKGAKFFLSPKDSVHQYDRMFVEYKIEEGLLFFSEFSIHCSLSDAGFTRVVVLNDCFFTKGFGDNGDERVINNKAGRKWLVDNLCKYGVAVSNSL